MNEQRRVPIRFPEPLRDTPVIGPAIFLTNQFHKWAHMESPPRPIAWLQGRDVILSPEHHDIHHRSPFDTHYCITAGWWNPLLERTGAFAWIVRKVRSQEAARR